MTSIATDPNAWKAMQLQPQQQPFSPNKPPKAPPGTGGYTPGTAIGGTVPLSTGNASQLAGSFTPQKTLASMQPQQQQFTAQNNLISTQFNPVDSKRTMGAAGMTNQAASNFAGMTQTPTAQVAGPDYSRVLGAMQGQGMQGFVPAQLSKDAQNLRTMTLADLEQVRGGADRGQLAADSYNLMAERSLPEFEKRQRELGQKTAALGRIGSGIYGSELTDLNTARERELSLSRRELANSAAGQTLADRLAQLQATQGVGDQLYSQDVNIGAMNAGAYGSRMDANMDQARFFKDIADSEYQARFNERGYGDTRSDVGFDKGRSQFTTLADYEQGLRGNDYSDRNEMRGERDYQYGLDRDARRDYEADQAFQYGVGRDRVADDQWRFNALNQYGNGADPTQIQQYLSDQYRTSGEQGMAGFGDSLSEYQYQQALRRPQQQPPPRPGGQQYNGASPYDDAVV